MFWGKNIEAKGAHKMLMKLTPVANFTDNLQAAFLRRNSFHKNLQNQIVIREKVNITLFNNKAAH
jgi:hypothetical protein